MTAPVRVHKLSASKLDLASHCLYWAREDLRLPPDESSKEALEGRAFHAVAAHCITARELTPGFVAALCGEEAEKNDTKATAIERRVTGWLVQWPTVAPPDPRAEVVYVYDPFTGEVREEPWREDRDWRKHPREIVAIVDVESIEGELAQVIDHKTGQERGSAEAARQLAMAALCVSKRHPEVKRVRVAFHYIDEDGAITEDAAELDTLDLMGLEGELLERVETVDPPTQPGPHCVEQFCRALTVCPHWQRECKTLVPEERFILSMANIANAYDRLKVAQKMLDSYENAIKSLAREAGGIRLNNGKYWVEREYEGRMTLDAKALKAEHPDIADEFTDQGRAYKRFVQVNSL